MPEMRPFLLCACGALAFAACDATNTTLDEGRAGPPEAIDRVEITLTGPTTETFVVNGLASGGPIPSAEGVDLDSLATYTGQIRFADDVDAEIRAEVESHRVEFAPSSDAIAVEITDRESLYAVQNLNDGDYPVGLRFRLTTTNRTGPAALEVRLRHYEGAPKTSAAGGGSVDVTVTVPLVIEAD